MTRLRWLARLEATTLVLLLAAVPVRYLLRDPAPVHVLGPIHGAVFTLYLVTLAQAAFGELRLPVARAARLLLLGCLPFGGFLAAQRVTRRG